MFALELHSPNKSRLLQHPKDILGASFISRMPVELKSKEEYMQFW